jgi:hypothetical protein
MNINEQMKCGYSHSLNKISGAIPLYLTVRGSNAYGTNIYLWYRFCRSIYTVMIY